MKTLKFALVIGLITAGTTIFSQTNESLTITQTNDTHSVIRMPITKAFLNHSLLLVMYQQIDESLIAAEKPGLYEARIKYGNIIYIIYGKLPEWQKFFLMDPCPKCVQKKKINGR